MKSVTVLELGDDGVLHVPGDMLAGAGPHSRFEVDNVGNVTVLRPAGTTRPFWRQANPAQRAEVFRLWADAPRPSGPDLPPDSLRRESIYDVMTQYLVDTNVLLRAVGPQSAHHAAAVRSCNVTLAW